jgi:pimeloyl-ACP methyl ester carboxylesterase
VIELLTAYRHGMTGTDPLRSSISTWHSLQHDGARIACLDFGGTGLPVVLLHGLAGHAGEWAETAGWLTERHRVVALDVRGHGHSERAPDDVSRAAHVADVAFVIERLGLRPVVLVGQSLGGHLAILVAARCPTLVRALVVAEASPAGAGEQGAARIAAEVRTSLARWPVPFASREAAVTFFGGPSVSADAWAAGLEQRDDGWWPTFDLDVMARTLRQAIAADYWNEWERIHCPALIVRAGAGQLTTAQAQEMVDRLPHARLAELPDAPHDLHLGQPEAWRDAVAPFLSTLSCRS